MSVVKAKEGREIVSRGVASENYMAKKKFVLPQTSFNFKKGRLLMSFWLLQPCTFRDQVGRQKYQGTPYTVDEQSSTRSHSSQQAQCLVI